MNRAIYILFCLSISVLQTTVVHADIEDVELPPIDPSLPSYLQSLHKVTDGVNYSKKGSEVQLIRINTIKKAAFSWGVQEGVYWRYNKIIEIMEQQSTDMATTFDFNKFLIDGKMLCPVIIESERMFEQSSDQTVRTVTHSFTLEKPARLVPRAPNWRDFLIRKVDEPVRPDSVIFPRNDEETLAWREALNKGWKQGIKQAEHIFELDLARLKKEIEGMFRFRKLLSQGVVTLPKIESSKYSILRLEDGKTINMNDVIYSITVPSGFTETDKWEPLFRTSAR